MDDCFQVGPSVDDMFSHCYWRGTPHDCNDFWRLQRTEEGFCYSFNSKTAERNNIRSVKKKDEKKKSKKEDEKLGIQREKEEK
jgi:Amiloride-sensitive sodium channel.